MADAPSPAQLRALNLQNRQLTLGTSIEMTQSIYKETINNYVSGNALSRNIPIKNVGLTKKLLVFITATVQQGAAETQTLTNFGPANIFSNVQFADYSNYVRINTTGWHLDAVATAKAKMPYASAYTTNNPVKTGGNYPVKVAPTTVTTAQTMNMVYEIPFAYTDDDLTGAILSQVLNANAYFSYTLNPNLFATSTGNPVQSVYQSSTAQLGAMPSITVEIYQIYLDQLPQQNGVMILPAIDLSNVYGLYNTSVSGIASNSDNPYNFTNYRQFLSTFVIYDNNGVLAAGTDINRFKLQAANMTNIWDVSPVVAKTIFERKIIGDDFPVGSYYFDFRRKPISTSVNGNMQLLLNPSGVTNNNSQFLMGLEYIALLNQVAQAGSVLQ